MGKISKEDKISVKNLRIEKRWGARKLICEFPYKFWDKFCETNSRLASINFIDCQNQQLTFLSHPVHFGQKRRGMTYW